MTHSFGLGLRKPHYNDVIEGDVALDFVEVISENFMVDGGRPRDVLRRVREKYPVALHGVSMSVGSADGIDRAYLKRLRSLVDDVDPLFVSDHLCWTRIGGFNTHDLLPLPYSVEALDIVAANVAIAQDMLGRAMLIENPSSYIDFPDAGMTEWGFLDALCARTGCRLLLDVNNIYVSAANHGFDALAYVDAVPADRIAQIHLAGHSQGEALLIDTHDAPVCDGVWALYDRLIARTGPIPTMIERDDAIPPIEELLDELSIARGIADAHQKRIAA